MVWEEIKLACATYPVGNEKFVSSLIEEVDSEIARSHSNPSLAFVSFVISEGSLTLKRSAVAESIFKYFSLAPWKNLDPYEGKMAIGPEFIDSYIIANCPVEPPIFLETINCVDYWAISGSVAVINQSLNIGVFCVERAGDLQCFWGYQFFTNLKPYLTMNKAASASALIMALITMVKLNIAESGR